MIGTSSHSIVNVHKIIICPLHVLKPESVVSVLNDYVFGFTEQGVIEKEAICYKVLELLSILIIKLA